ncbi:phage-related minor tail protein [Methylobacterium sp. GXF4]|uniref:hypothetical protein n=1 Tax=Methylobacterium sp. GXF4 TaxID=1096546 RepID=UPI0002698F4D|nr:hypothetical protein [Methylobacterium sp. GXF4]EIZ87144.1 phage-related minor tail protein [Methylobacterium sp. GXF4]
MGMGQELKDFVNGFSSGYKLATPTEAEMKRQDRDRDEANIDKEAAGYAGGIPGRGGVKPYTYKGGDEAEGGSKPSNSGFSKLPAFATDMGDLTSLAQSLSKVESGGRYDALGPVTKKGDRAYGRYQVMGANIPSWTKEHLGKSMTPQEFLNDPVAQDKVFQGEFGKQIKKYGNPADAASVWHSGRPLATAAKLGLSDGNMKTVDYARAVTGGAAPRMAVAPAAVQGRNPAAPVISAPAPAAALELPAPTPGGRAMSMPGDQAVLDDEQYAPTQMAAEGGIIAPVMQMPADDEASAPPLPPRRPSDAELQDVPGNNSAPAEPDYHRLPGLHEALDAGMSSIARTFGLDGQTSALPDARSDRAAQVSRYHANEGAATPDDIRQIDQTIDPDNRLASDAKAIARLKAGYDYFLKRGEPDKAKKYSESILLYTRQAVQYAGASAEQKLKSGDIAGAAKDIQSAHNQIPDGSSMYVDKVGPNGTVDYRIVDEDGDLTERGQATANQLLYLATGMKNGSEWLQQMQNARAGSLTAAQKLAEKRKAQDEKSYGAYLDAGGGNQDVVAKLSPEAQDALKKMSPAVRARAIQELVQRDAQTRAQTSQEQRQAKDDRRQEFYQRREAAQDKKGTDQQEYAGHAAAVENARDALAEQMQADPDDTPKVQAAQKALNDAIRAGRDWAAGDTGRAAYVPQLERIARPAGRGAGGRAGGGTEDERKVAGLDQQFVRLQRAVDRETDPEKKTQLQAQLPHQRAAIEFQKRDTGFDDDLGTKVDQVVPSILGVKEGATLSDAQQTDASDYGSAVTGLLRGDNALTPKRAADIAKLAVKTGKIEVLDNGAYSINGSDPVYMPPQAIAALARIRQRNKPAAPATTTVPNPMRQDAENQYTPNEMDDIRSAADRRQARQSEAPARRTRDKSAEYQRLKDQMGDAMYARVQKQFNKSDDTVPLAMMRKIVREQGRGAAFGRDVNTP